MRSVALLVGGAVIVGFGVLDVEQPAMAAPSATAVSALGTRMHIRTGAEARRLAYWPDNHAGHVRAARADDVAAEVLFACGQMRILRPSCASGGIGRRTSLRG